MATPPRAAFDGTRTNGTGLRFADAQAVLTGSVGCTAEAALAPLVGLSQRTKRPPRDIDQNVVAGTAAPGLRPDSETG